MSEAASVGVCITASMSPWHHDISTNICIVFVLCSLSFQNTFSSLFSLICASAKEWQLDLFVTGNYKYLVNKAACLSVRC